MSYLVQGIVENIPCVTNTVDKVGGCSAGIRILFCTSCYVWLRTPAKWIQMINSVVKEVYLYFSVLSKNSNK